MKKVYFETNEIPIDKLERVANIGYWQWDILNDKVTFSPEMCNIFGICIKGNITYQHFLDLVGDDYRSLVDGKIQDSLKNGTPCHVDYEIRKDNGDMITIESNSEVEMHNGLAVRMFSVIKNVTLERKQEEELKTLALRDPGTNLYNKRFFQEQLDVTVNRSLRNSTSLGLLLIDMDDFSIVNNEHGHLIGDKVIAELANRIGNVFSRKVDIVARYGGDEFVVLCSDLTLDSLKTKCQQLLDEFKMPIIYGDQEIIQTCSIGLCYSNRNKDLTSDYILTKADDAMYEAKSAGKNTFRICTR